MKNLSLKMYASEMYTEKIIGNGAEGNKQAPTGVENPSYDTERKCLKAIAFWSFIILSIIIIACGVLLGFRDNLKYALIWACLLAGILGSTSSALISALQRKANGWETEDGKKYPISDGKITPMDDRREMFSQRMATFFWFRPTFGVIGGVLIFYGAQSYFSIVSTSKVSTENESHVIFWAILAGLFIKTFIEKLKNKFDI